MGTSVYTLDEFFSLLTVSKGHLLWNAGRNVAAHLEEHAGSMVHQKQILELGAGAGLPSLVSAIMGAKKVVVTDYPELELIENLQFNISSCHLLPPSSVVPQGFLWGSSPDELLAMTEAAQGFDLLILADLLFNHSEHQKLLSTVRSTLRKSADAQALVFFTPYRPWLYEKDMAFFDLAQKGGFSVHKIMEKTLEKVMFENDPGDEVLRRTVYGYSLHWI